MMNTNNSPSLKARRIALVSLCAVISLATACVSDEEPKKNPPNTPGDVDMGMGSTTPDTPTDLPDHKPDMDMGSSTDTCVMDSDCDAGNHCDEGLCKLGACREADKNACGGCATLDQEIGAACGQCNKDQLECAPDAESLVCNGDTACDTPSVTTDEVSNITQYAATAAGSVDKLGDSPVQEHGFCLSAQPSPELGAEGSDCSTLGALSAPGPFTEELDSLELDTPYYVRAYATNASGTSYGQSKEFRTAEALLPQVRTLKVTADEDGKLIVSAQLDDLGIPVHQGYGVCLGQSADPALGDGQSSCTDLGTTDKIGPYSAEFASLALGLTYHVRAFARSEAGASYGQDLEITLRPAQPSIMGSSKGTSRDKVSVTWSPVEGATGYRIYRDGQLITAQPVMGLSFDDTNAMAGAAPTNIGFNLTATSDQQDKVSLSWAAPRVTTGQRHLYQVSAVNSGGESELSAAEDGFRGAQPITKYQISAGGGAWTDVSARTYDDLQAPAGAISQANASASQGTNSRAVLLNITGADATPGASVNYKVRAVSAAGPGQESDPVQGSRSAPTLTYQWQRSSGTSDAGYSNLSGATARSYSDTSAPPNEVVRYYRAIITAAGQPTTTAGVPGFRGANVPELSMKPVTNISTTGATLVGKVDNMGSYTSINPHGYCWSESVDPAYNTPGSTCVSLGAKTAVGDMSARAVTGLSPNKRYYVRAFGQIIKGGQPFMVYSNNEPFVTRSAAVTGFSASTTNSAQVRLTWPALRYVDSYKLYRNNVLIQTIQSSPNSFRFSYDDVQAPAPPVPGAPASATVRNSYCNSVELAWTAAPAPGPGASATYKIVAVNAAGESAASFATGNRAAAPIEGYRVRNTSFPNQPTFTTAASTFSWNLFNLRAPTITTGSLSASRGTYANYVELKSTGASKGSVPSDRVEIVAFNASGDGLSRPIFASRRDCDLLIKWQRSNSNSGPFSDLPGASGSYATKSTHNDTSAPASGARVYYRALLLTAGADAFAVTTPVDAGFRLSRDPKVITSGQGSSATTSTTLTVQFIITDKGIPTYNSAGACISTGVDPTVGSAGSTCLSNCSMTSVAGIVSGTCRFTGLSPQTRYFARAFVGNARTAPGHVYGANEEYRTAR